MKNLILALFLLGSSARADQIEPNQKQMLSAAALNVAVTAFLAQHGLRASQLTFVQAPHTHQLCTFMTDNNSCSLSFRAVSRTETVLSGAIHYDGITKKWFVFQMMDGEPREGSDFEAFSRD